MHTPWLFSGGIDIKAGQFVTLEGAETIDPTTNYLYSHSYIFNFGIPLMHTGIMTISHVDPLVDIYAGVTTGVNTTFGDVNVANPSFHGGIGLNLLVGNLTILATTHIGAQTPNTNGTNNTIDFITACNCNPGTTLRYLNDITATWKINNSWTLITDANFILDDGTYSNAAGSSTFHPNGYGIAQYAIYTVNDWLKVVGRVEVWRDNNNFFVAAFPGNFDFVNAEHGFVNTSIAVGPLGAEPPISRSPAASTSRRRFRQGTPLLQSITFRPEVRYDTSLNGTTPFDGAAPSASGAPPVSGSAPRARNSPSAATSSQNSKTDPPGT